MEQKNMLSLIDKIPSSIIDKISVKLTSSIGLCTIPIYNEYIEEHIRQEREQAVKNIMFTEVVHEYAEKQNMSNDISTMYTQQANQTKGRKGYGMWKFEKETSISPKDYGQFILSNKHKGNHKKKKGNK